MQPTRRFWETVAVGAVLAVAALAFDQPGLLVGAGGVAAWLLAAQVVFVYDLRELDEGLRIVQTVERPVVLVEEETVVTLAATAPETDLDVTIEARPTAGLLASGTTSTGLDDDAVFTVSSSVAGTHALRSPTVSLTGRLGFYTERLTRGRPAELTVEQRTPRRFHVGAQGTSLPTAFGEHAAETTGSGLVPAELREYVPGESVRRIDWKATARLTDTYVREFEAESDVSSLFIIDHRGSLRVGSEGETAFDYLRTAALGYLAAARSIRDLVGCYAVGDEGVTQLTTPTNTTRGYDRTRRRIRGLDPGSSVTRPRQFRPVARRCSTLDTETAFDRTLRPFVDTRPLRSADDSLEAAVRVATARQRGATQVVLFTDDSNHAAITAAVSRATRRDTAVLVFLAPRVLFEPGALSDLDRAYDRYLAFERFRQELSNTRNVEAFEVAPRDRIETVLGGRRTESRVGERRR